MLAASIRRASGSRRNPVMRLGGEVIGMKASAAEAQNAAAHAADASTRIARPPISMLYVRKDHPSSFFCATKHVQHL
jgi:hypothetical protein